MCSKKNQNEEHALTVLLTPCICGTCHVSKHPTSFPCAPCQPIPAGGQRSASPLCGKGGGHEARAFVEAGPAGKHCQVTSRLPCPDSSSSLCPGEAKPWKYGEHSKTPRVPPQRAAALCHPLGEPRCRELLFRSCCMCSRWTWAEPVTDLL